MTIAPELIAYVLVVYLLAGMVKGVVGLGMPTISLALIAALFGLKEAMVLLLVPSFVTNFWQGVTGGQLVAILRRIWPMLAVMCSTTWFATGIMLRSDAKLLSACLGGVLIIYAAISLATPQIAPPGRRETWMGPFVGFLTGISTGFTGTFVVPGVLYLQALGLGKDGLVQAMGICFTAATLALGLSLNGRGFMPNDLGLLSAAAVLPALAGMVLGRKIRDRLPEAKFRKIFFIALLILGAWILARSVFL
jgi:uncharacterized membrane protein YfcA